VTAIANEFIENAAWTSGIHLVECTGVVRANIFDANQVHVGPGGIETEDSSVPISFNMLRNNWGASIASTRSTGDIVRNLIVGTQGDCCGYGMAIQDVGCGFFRIENNTLYENGLGGGQNAFWASELHMSSQWALRNLIVHEEMDNVVTCDGGNCSYPPAPFPDAQNWLSGTGALLDWYSSGYCPDVAAFDDPLLRDPARDNFFLRPNSFCDIDTTVGTHIIKQFFGALPKASRPSGLLNVSRPSDAWPSVSPSGSSYVLAGFSITNAYRYDASINYRVISPSGLLRDNGDPLSLVGSTPVLAPGESFTPPPAALEVPAGTRTVVVKYAYAYAPALNIVDTVQTLVHFASPVPVRVMSFKGNQRDTGVTLEWTTSPGTSIDGWNVYRAAGDEAFRRITATPLSGAARSYSDSRVVSGIPYRYRLVALDPDEIIAGETSVTPSIALTLDQNSPNPFRAQTTLRFTMPGPARATLAVYAVDGKLVRLLLDEPISNLTREVVWDGRDANGKLASSGVYFCRLTVDSHSLTRKLVLAR
jgi:hypothetical protein